MKETHQTLTDAVFYILLALRRPNHGYGVVQQVEQMTGGRLILGPGTLYTILARFQEEGLIVETAVEGRKRTYAITERGRALFRQELSRLKLCVADGDREEGQA
mgnify:CR=1 FL=1